MIKKACFLVLITVFINCSSETDEIEETLPVVSISELDNLIEKKTTFNVSISEIDKPTNTTVLINENEIISTNKKDFEVEINPFDYPNGKTTLTVKTVSSNNRETVENKEFEIKKLLFRSVGGLSSDSVDSYLAINLQSTGKLVAFKKITPFDNTIFFHAEDNFVEEDIIVTQYSLGTDSGFYVAKMYGNVKLGTELISTREAANELGLDFVNPNNQSTYNITIEGTTNYGLFSMLGMGYTFDNSSAPSFEIKYDETLTKDVFLYYFDQSNENILDNYRYAYIDNLTDQTIQFEKMSLPQIDNIFTLDVPETVKRAGITLLGYANEDEYRENFFSILFGNSIETGSSGFSISYPDVKEYPIIVKSISLDFLDGSQMTFVQKGTPDITKPNITVQKNKDVIQINGEHDFSKLELEIAHPDTQKDDVFRMTYKNQSLGAINLPFETFEIPEEIVQIVNTSGLGINTRNNSGIMKLRIEKYQNKTFPNGVFYVPLRKEFGDEFYWSMPIKD